jgi:two-component system chemotaxis response regulator CheY
MDALDVLEKSYEEIRLILLDWNMPGMNGFDFLLAVKGNRFFKSIPVMMITTEGEKGNIIKAVQAGVNNYLLKPFKTEELTKKIIEITGSNG